MSQLFGFQIQRKEGKKGQSPVPPNAEESIAVAAGGTMERMWTRTIKLVMSMR